MAILSKTTDVFFSYEKSLLRYIATPQRELIRKASDIKVYPGIEWNAKSVCSSKYVPCNVIHEIFK